MTTPHFRRDNTRKIQEDLRKLKKTKKYIFFVHTNRINVFLFTLFYFRGQQADLTKIRFYF